MPGKVSPDRRIKPPPILSRHGRLGILTSDDFGGLGNKEQFSTFFNRINVNFPVFSAIYIRINVNLPVLSALYIRINVNLFKFINFFINFIYLYLPEPRNKCEFTSFFNKYSAEITGKITFILMYSVEKTDKITFILMYSVEKTGKFRYIHQNKCDLNSVHH